MGDQKSSIIRDRDRELLLPITNTPIDDEQLTPKPLSSSAISFSQHAGREVFIFFINL